MSDTADNPEVEITPAMLKAGLAAFIEWRAAPLGISNPVVVKRVYTAMELAKVQTPAE